MESLCGKSNGRECSGLVFAQSYRWTTPILGKPMDQMKRQVEGQEKMLGLTRKCGSRQGHLI